MKTVRSALIGNKESGNLCSRIFYLTLARPSISVASVLVVMSSVISLFISGMLVSTSGSGILVSRVGSILGMVAAVVGAVVGTVVAGIVVGMVVAAGVFLFA